MIQLFVPLFKKALLSACLFLGVCVCVRFPSNKIPCYHSPRAECSYKAAMSDSNFCAKKWGRVALTPQDNASDFHVVSTGLQWIP